MLSEFISGSGQAVVEEIVLEICLLGRGSFGGFDGENCVDVFVASFRGCFLPIRLQFWVVFVRFGRVFCGFQILRQRVHS